MKEIKTHNTTDFYILVDDEDFDRVSKYEWFYRKGHDIRTHCKLGLILGRFILGLTSVDTYYVDHINGNILDNRKENLRKVNSSQSCMNRLGWGILPKGVKRARGFKKYEARIHVNKKYIHLGTFYSVEKAKEAYDNAALKYYGEYACIENSKF